MDQSRNQGSAALKPIARPSGALAMVAIDQRDSLRMMFQAKRGEPVSDEVIVDFKVAVAETLGGDASAMLFDRHLGWPALARLASRRETCGRILAVDRLIQDPGQPVSDTDLDAEADLSRAREHGVAALKFLVLWKSGSNAERCRTLAARFVELCRAHEYIGVLEAMVRPPESGSSASWDREQAIVAAARALAPLGPDLYKGEVPFHGRAKPEAIRDRCKEISALLQCPWVVLSQGVDPADFPAAVRAACAGGASGFLAGRAIWADTIGPGDCRPRLVETALPRLRALVDIVDAAALPRDAVNRRQ